MGNSSKDKGSRDQKKKPAMTQKEKRRAKNEKKHPTPALGVVASNPHLVQLAARFVLRPFLARSGSPHPDNGGCRARRKLRHG